MRCLIVASYAAALALKFDGDIPRVSMVFFGKVVVLIVLAYIVGNYSFGIYRTAWQYAGLADAITLGFAVGLVSILLMGIDVFLNPRDIPLTVTLTAPPLILLSMGAAKLWPRLRTQVSFFAPAGPVQHLLVAGAGTTGQMLAREFLEHPDWGYKTLGFVDDDPRKQGIRIHGLPVLGNRYDIRALAESHHIDVVALAMPSATGATIREFVGMCQETGAAVRTVPGVPEIVHAGGAASLREITVDDLLGRPPAEIDIARCAAVLRGREVLITGAAGYLGGRSWRAACSRSGRRCCTCSIRTRAVCTRCNVTSKLRASTRASGSPTSSTAPGWTGRSVPRSRRSFSTLLRTRTFR